MTDHEITPSPVSSSPGDAVAQASEEKASVRAIRAWYQRKRIAVPSAVFLVFLIIMVSTGGNDPGFLKSSKDAVASGVRSVTSPTPVIGTLGQSVRDGKFSFVVTSRQEPGKTITDRLGHTQTAQGEFVIVRVSVANIGYEARTLNATDQFLINDKGQRYATSSAVSVLRGTEMIFQQRINPGSTVNDVPLLFDVPAGTSIADVELHGSLSSAGVKVTLP